MTDIRKGRRTINEWADKFLEFKKGFEEVPIAENAVEELELDPGHKRFRHENGWIYQSLVLTERSFLTAVRNPILYWIRVAMFSKLYPELVLKYLTCL